MTIYILDQQCAKTADYLDDKSLDLMIKNIRQVFCNIQHLILSEKCFNGDISDSVYFDEQKKIPLNYKNEKFLNLWCQWARQCKDNYSCLSTFLWVLCMEYTKYRKLNNNLSKLLDVLEDWPINHIPDSPSREGKLFQNKNILLPLIMPKKYIVNRFNKGEPYTDVVASYRNYYNSKLKEKFKYCNSIFESESEICVGHGKTYKEVNWTKREKPDWIKL